MQLWWAKHRVNIIQKFLLTSWLAAWESFPFVQSLGGEKMELLSYSSIRKIWMEGIEFSSQKVPKSILPPFKKCTESYSKKSGLQISQTDASSPPSSPQDNLLGQLSVDYLRQVKRNHWWGPQFPQSFRFHFSHKLKNKTP